MKMGMGVRQHDQRTLGEEGLQMLVSGWGKPDWVLSSPLPLFLRILPLGSDPGNEERPRQPHPAMLGFCQGIYLP